MDKIYQIESWIKEHWILLVISLVVLIILVFLTFLVMKIFHKWKTANEIKSIWKNKMLINLSVIDYLSLNDVNLKFWGIELKKLNNNKKIAWYALVGILTRVIANKYDLDYGNPKEALGSLYAFYKELREEIKKYPSTFKSNIVILLFMNQELRPFLTKWNFLINEKYKDFDLNNLNVNETQVKPIEEFIKDFNLMYDSIIRNKYIENLFLILGWNVSIKDITLPDGVESFKNNNITLKKNELV